MYFLAHSSALRMNEIYNMEVLLFINHLLSFIPVRLYHVIHDPKRQVITLNHTKLCTSVCQVYRLS